MLIKRQIVEDVDWLFFLLSVSVGLLNTDRRLREREKGRDEERRESRKKKRGKKNNNKSEQRKTKG